MEGVLTNVEMVTASIQIYLTNSVQFIKVIFFGLEFEACTFSLKCTDLPKFCMNVSKSLKHHRPCPKILRYIGYTLISSKYHCFKLYVLFWNVEMS